MSEIVSSNMCKYVESRTIQQTQSCNTNAAVEADHKNIYVNIWLPCSLKQAENILHIIINHLELILIIYHKSSELSQQIFTGLHINSKMKTEVKTLAAALQSCETTLSLFLFIPFYSLFCHICSLFFYSSASSVELSTSGMWAFPTEYMPWLKFKGGI